MSQKIVIVPLIGCIDAKRTEGLMSTLLARINEYQPRVAFLDISGVPEVDDEVTGYLDKIIKALQWQGVQTMVIGGLSEK